jgi:hypothetical protein
MSRHDERLQNLVLARAEAALGMASFLLSVADPCQEVDYNDIVIEPSAIRNMQDDLLQLDALTCGLMHDAGMFGTRSLATTRWLANHCTVDCSRL